MHHQLNPIAAQERVADLHRAADHDRLVHTATTATSSHAVLAPRDPAGLVPALAPPPGLDVPVARERSLEGGQPQTRKRSRPDRQQRYRLRRRAIADEVDDAGDAAQGPQRGSRCPRGSAVGADVGGRIPR